MRAAYSVSLLSRAGDLMGWIFIPLLGLELGLSYVEIGLIVAAYQLGSVLASSFFGWLSDTVGRRKVFVVASCGCSALVLAAHTLAHNFISLLAVRLLAGVCFGAMLYPLVAYVSSSSNYERFVGFLNAMGGVGWLIGCVMAGVLGEFHWIFTAAALFFAAAFLCSLFMEERRVVAERRRVEAWRVFRRGQWLYTAYFLRHFAACNIWAIFPILLAMLGASKFWIGVLYAINSGFQVVSMSLAGYLAEKGWEKMLVRGGIALSALVFTAYWLAHSYLQIVPAQVALGFAWGFLYVGPLIFLLRRRPLERATATGFLGSVISVASIAGSFTGGVVAELLTPMGNPLVGVAIAIVALAVSTKI